MSEEAPMDEIEDVEVGRQTEQTVCPPNRKSFVEFLTNDARVPCGRGQHGPYSFAGREALQAVVEVIDRILGAEPGHGMGIDVIDESQDRQISSAIGRRGAPPSESDAGGTPALQDAELALAGGAQFGKTILELNLAAYCTSQLFRNFGLYLPDDDLVEGIVDSKFRPDVVDQIGWFARMAQVGKALNKSGKAVNRKGAFLVTDGQRKAVGMIRGLGKVPTTFSMDIAMMDEVDDIEPKMMKFVRGRLTASDLRFIMKIGTQRVHGRGMNKAWKDGSQGVFVLECPKCGRRHCAEEEFPEIIRLRNRATFNIQHPTPNIQSGTTTKEQSNKGDDPKLIWSGEFESGDGRKWGHEPGNEYYLGCVACGTELDRTKPIQEHRQPERIKQRNWSFRISQLAIAAIDLSQIVSRFQLAVADPEEMIVFRCDVLALPQSTSQGLSPIILERARTVAPYDLKPRVTDGCIGVAGLDMGDRCWLWVREIGKTFNTQHSTSNIQQARLLAAEKMSAGDVVKRTIELFHRLGLSALFIDERPLVNEARALALALNGLQDLAQWPKVPDARDAYLTLPGGLTWDGRNARWVNLKCAVVRFTRNKLGAGISQNIIFFEEGGQTKFVPCIECNRFETIDRVVREFLTPEEGIIDVAGGNQELVGTPRCGVQDIAARCPYPIGSETAREYARPTIRQSPMVLLPRMGPGHAPILDTVEAHLITGSEREKLSDGSLGDYVDGCDNHFLLADGYSKLAEIICSSNNRPVKFAYERVEVRRKAGGLY